MVIVVVTQRRDDYMAHIKGHPEMWDRGRSPEEAVRKLMVTFKEIFPKDAKMMSIPALTAETAVE